MNTKHLTLLIVIGILVLGNVFFASKYFKASAEVRTLRADSEKTGLNEKVLNFASMFIREVLQADGEVDFETRLSLETAVRNLGDEEILAQWQKFVESKTEAGAQDEVKNLLELLVSKVKVR